MVNKKGSKKTKVKKPKTPAARPITESVPQPTLEQVESNIIGNVVRKLAPEMNKSIEAKFEEMKTIFKNELQDIRKHMEAAPIDDVEPVSTSPTTSEPLNAQDLTVPQAQEKAGLDSLLPIIQMLGLNKPEQSMGNNALMNMFMESMMRNSMANLTRNDGMQDLMMKAAFKKILGEEPPANIMKTTSELMSPLNNYGDKAQAERDKAKS